MVFFETWQALVEQISRDISKPERTMSHEVYDWMHSRRLDLGLPYAYVKIAQGCSEHCSFCTIPSIKGHYISKPSDLVLAEIGSFPQEPAVRGRPIRAILDAGARPACSKSMPEPTQRGC